MEKNDQTNQRIWVLAVALLVLTSAGYVSKKTYDRDMRWEADRSNKLVDQDKVILRQRDTIDSVQQENKDLQDQLHWYRCHWEQQMEGINP